MPQLLLPNLKTRAALISRNKRGFTLIEVLVVVVIIAIVSVVAIALYNGVTKKARDARRQSDINALSKAYEVKYKDKYYSLTGSEISGGTLPTDPGRSVNYFNAYLSDGSGYKVCAALEDHPSNYCNSSSPTCFCKVALQGQPNAGSSIVYSYPAEFSSLGYGGGTTTHPTSCDSSGTLDDGLIGYWRMDESSWNNNCSAATTIDSSGNNHNLLSCLAGSGPSTNSMSKNNRSGSFDGIDDLLRSSGTISGFNLDNLTVSAWVYLTALPTSFATPKTAMIAAQTNSGSPPFAWQLHISKDFNSPCFEWQNSTTKYYSCKKIDAPNDVKTGLWYLVTGVKDGNQVRTYLNGVYTGVDLGTTASGTVLPANSYFQVGSWGDSKLQGYIDDLRIYNRALSQTEINNLYSFPSGSGCFP